MPSRDYAPHQTVAPPCRREFRDLLRFEGDRLLKPAYLTVFLNGVLLHNRKETAGPTVHRALAKYTRQPTADSLMLQDHGTPVRYRNIWVRRLQGYDQ